MDIEKVNQVENSQSDWEIRRKVCGIWLVFVEAENELQVCEENNQEDNSKED